MPTPTPKPPAPASPLPWRIACANASPGYEHIADAAGGRIVFVDDLASPAYAPLIVEAVNALAERDALREALRLVLDSVGAFSNPSEMQNVLNLPAERGAEILALARKGA